jgi:hypothetical protein
LKAVREKKQITYKVSPSKSQQTSQQKHQKQEELGVRSSGHRMKITSTLGYSAKLSFKIDGAIKVMISRN